MVYDPVIREQSSQPFYVGGNLSLDISDAEFAQIGRALQNMRGFNLDAYKDKCVRRRIAIRIRANHCESVKEYCEILSSDPKEVDLLLKVLTIHVSQFFRNPSTYEKLRQEVIPFLFSMARQEGAQSLRFWSIGCASGEEPYTLALILAEHFTAETARIPVTIDATDVDSSILETARQGVYTQERLVDIPQHYLQRYFTRDGGQFVLSQAIRDMVTFRQGDLLHDVIYQPCDLLLCRNVMIYFAREQQEKIIHNIARVLNRWGFMVLGKSETLLGESRSHFHTVCPVERIYRLSANAAARS